MEDFLRDLEAFIGAMADEDRDRAGQALAYVIGVLRKYPNRIRPAAFFKFISSLGIAAGIGKESTDRFWAKVKKRSAEIGPHVGAVFQAF